MTIAAAQFARHGDRLLLPVRAFHHRREGLSAVERVLDAEMVRALAFESISVPTLPLGALRMEGQGVPFPLAARRSGRDEAHRVGPIPAIFLRLGVVAKETVTAEHDLAVLFFDIVLDDVEAVEIEA